MPISKIRDMARGNPLSPPSSAEASVPQRVTLPSDLSTSLRYVDDAELERLRVPLPPRSIAAIKALQRGMLTRGWHYRVRQSGRRAVRSRNCRKEKQT